MNRLSEQELEYRRKSIMLAMECGSYKLAAQQLGISESQLHGRITHLGIRGDILSIRKARRDRVEDEVMAQVHDGMDDNCISLALGISKQLVGQIRRNHGVRRYASGRCRKFHGNRRLRAMMMSDLYGKYTVYEIADAFGCTPENVSIIIRRERGE